MWDEIIKSFIKIFIVIYFPPDLIMSYNQGIRQYVPTYQVHSDYLPQNRVEETVDGRTQEAVFYYLI